MTTDTMTTTQVYRVYIKATPQAIWDAITDPSGPSATATPAGPTTTSVRVAPTGRTRARR